MGIHWKDGYSSSVEIWLVVDGEKLNVAQVGSESLILRSPRRLEQCTAELQIVVDDRTDKYRIVLFEGALAGDPLVKFFVADERPRDSGILQSR